MSIAYLGEKCKGKSGRTHNLYPDLQEQPVYLLTLALEESPLLLSSFL